MRKNLEDLKKDNIIRKRLPPPSGETSGRSRQWGNKNKVREENAQTEQKKPTNHASDVESKLQITIKAATT